MTQEKPRDITGEILAIAPLMKSPERNPKTLEGLDHYLLFTSAHDYPGMSPRMWAATYEHLGMHGQAAAFLVAPEAQLAQLYALFREDPRYVGGGAGSGFKEKILPLLDKLDESATESGAVNFIVKEQGQLMGYNTDGEGFTEGLEQLLLSQGRTVSQSTIGIIGAGGTARAVAIALGKRGAQLMIINRTLARAEEVVARINERFGGKLAIPFPEDSLPAVVQEVDVLANTTNKADGPTKEYSALGPVHLPVTDENIAENRKFADEVLQAARPETVFVDVVLGYESTMLRQARERHFVTQDGLPMVVHQGAHAFYLLHHRELGERGITEQDVAKIMWQAVAK